MAISFFRKLVDQINPFDGGKTWKNPNPQNNIPSYGGGVAGLINRAKDMVSSTTPQDYARRNNEFISKLPKAINLSPEEIDQRRSFYQQKGLDINKLQKIKNYQDALNPGIRTDSRDWTVDFQKLQNEGLATPEAARDFNTGLTRQNQAAKNALIRGAIAKSLDFNGQQFTANQVEAEYQKLINRDKANIPSQALQNFAGGVYSFYRGIPGDVATVAGAGLDVVSPEGSRVDKYAEKLFGTGKRLNTQAQQDIQNRAYFSPKDNQAVAKLAQGAGSLFAMSLVPGGGTEVSLSSLKAAPLPAIKNFLLGVGGGAGLAGLQEAGDKTRAAKEAGKSDVVSFLTGLGAGASSAYSEQIGLDFLGKPLTKVGGNLIGGIASRALTEGTQESLQQLTSNLWEKSFNPNKNIYEGVVESGVVGGVLGGGIGAVAETPEFIQKFKSQNQTNNILEFAVSQNPQLQSVLIDVNNFVAQNPQLADTAALAIFGGGSLAQVQNAQTELAQYVRAISDIMGVPSAKSYKAIRSIMGGPSAKNYKTKDKFSDPYSGMKLFEISDINARLLFRPKPHTSSTLGEFLYHPELFNEYPELRNMPVKFIFDDPQAAGYQNKGVLYINTNNDSETVMSTLIHEIQHGLQWNEGRSQGGSHQYIMERTSLPLRAAFNLYERLAGEAQSRMVEARRRHKAATNLNIPQSYDTNPYSLFDQRDIVAFLINDKKLQKHLFVYSAYDHLKRGTLDPQDINNYAQNFGIKKINVKEDITEQKALDSKIEIEKQIEKFVDKKYGKKARELRESWRPMYPKKYYTQLNQLEALAVNSPDLRYFIRLAADYDVSPEVATEVYQRINKLYPNQNINEVRPIVKIQPKKAKIRFGSTMSMLQDLWGYETPTAKKYIDTINSIIEKLDNRIPDNYKTVLDKYQTAGDKLSDSIAMRDDLRLGEIFDISDKGAPYEYRFSQQSLGGILYNVTKRLKAGSTKKDIMGAFTSALFSNLKTLEESNNNQNEFDKAIASGSGDITLYRVTTGQENNSGVGIFYSPNKAYVETYIATNKLSPDNLKKYTINIDNLKIYSADNFSEAYKNVFGGDYRRQDTYYDGERIDELWGAEGELHTELAKRGFDAVVYKQPDIDNGYKSYTFGLYSQPREFVLLNDKLPKTIASTSYSQFGDKRQVTANVLKPEAESLSYRGTHQIYDATSITDIKNIDEIVANISPENSNAGINLSRANLPPAQQLVQDLADVYYSFDKSVKTELIVLEDGTKKKVSPHSQFYRDFYKANKKRPTKADFLEHAKNLLETEKAPAEFQNEYQRILGGGGNDIRNEITSRERSFITRYMDKVYNPLVPINDLENQLADWSMGPPNQSVPATALIAILDKYYDGSLENMVADNIGNIVINMPTDKPTSEIGMLGMTEKQRHRHAVKALDTVPTYEPPAITSNEKPLANAEIEKAQEEQKRKIKEVIEEDAAEPKDKAELEKEAIDKFTDTRQNPFTGEKSVMRINEYMDLLIEYWAAQRIAAKTFTANLLSDLPKPPDNLAWKVIEALEEKPSSWDPSIREYAQAYRDFFDKMLDFGNKNGLDIKKWEDYVTHIWEDDYYDVVSIFDEYKKLHPEFKYSKKRIIPDYETGIMLGLTPKYRTPQEIVEQYTNRMLRAVNDKFLMDQLIKDKLVSRGLVYEGFDRQITAPGFTVDKAQLYLAPAIVAKKLDNIFRDQQAYTNPEKVAKKIAQIARVAQDVGLSGGIPFTPLNAFTFANIQRYLLAGKGGTPLGALLHSFSRGKADNYFKENKDTILKMQQSGYDIQPEYEIRPEDQSTRDKLASFWDEAISDPTFKRFIPIMQIKMWQQINDGLIKKGVDDKIANRQATKILQNFEGQKNVGKVAQQSRFLNDITTIGLFAPRYRGAMFRFWVNNFTGPKKVSKYNRRFVIGAILVYGMYDFLNMILNGVHLWDNPDGKEDKLLIPLPDGNYMGVPFLSSIATVPRAIGLTAYHTIRGSDSDTFLKDVKGFSSYLLKPILDVVTNENYFGAQIVRVKDTKTKTKDTPLKAALKRGAYLGGAFLPTSIREPLKTFTQDQPLYQTATQLLEAPLRYYDPSFFKYKGEDPATPNIQIKYPDAVNQKKTEAKDKKKAEQGFDNAVKVKAESGVMSQNEMQRLKSSIESSYLYENKNGGISTDNALKNAYKTSRLTNEAINVAQFLNTTNLWQKPMNVPQLEPSNQLAVLFADTLEKAKDKNVAEKLTMLNNFWKDAVKTQYSDTAQSIIGMNDDEVEYLLKSGGITERQWADTLDLNLALTKMTGNSPLGKNIVGYTAKTLNNGGAKKSTSTKSSVARINVKTNVDAPKFRPTKARKIKVAKKLGRAKKVKIKI